MSRAESVSPGCEADGDPDSSAMSSPAPILLHAHLFKNAGTSLDWALQRSFGAGFVDHRDDDAMRGNAAYLRSYIERHPNLAALSSHWLPLPIESTLRREVFVVALLRDPILRLRSVYAFERRQSVDQPGTLKAREARLADYVAWRLGPESGPVIRNYQTRICSGTFPGDDDRAQLDAAKAALSCFAFVGLVERYDESMVLMEARLQPVFPALDLAYVAQNVTNAGYAAQDLAAQRAAIEDELGAVFERAERANAHDQRLYDQTASRFEELWSTLPDREDRLAEFRQRCKAINA